MQSIRRLVLPALATLLFAAPAARATTYSMVSDAQLADQASAVAEVRVTSVEAAPVQGRPATDYLVEVERLVGGSLPGSSLVVRVPGGERPDGMTLKIYGAPEFAVGERALLFLAPNGDGSFHILHLMLGAFHEVQAGGRSLAVRNLSEAQAVARPGETAAAENPEDTSARDLAKFSRWIADRAAGAARAADYFVTDVGPQSLRAPFTFFTNGGHKLRWFEFDSGQSVTWRAHNGGQPGVSGGGYTQFQNALNAWNAEPSTNINYTYSGQTSATAGFDDFDDLNVILFNHQLDDAFSCETGGVLAIGGPWYDPDSTGTFNGETFVRIGGADIETNAGLDCFFGDSFDAPRAAEELFGHELGHTLGLGHSCGDSRSGICVGPVNAIKNDALMRASIHDDGRGARLNADDRAGIRTLYVPNGSGGGGGSGPTAPGSLTATVQGLSVLLSWQDRSTNELGFRVYRGVASSALTLLATLPAGTTGYADTGLAANTLYTYQVAAFNNQGERRSAQVSVRTPAIQPVTVALQAPAGGQTGEPVHFQATFTGPARTARWEIGPDAVVVSNAPCGASLFCADHIFTSPGTYQVKVTVTGDQGQTAQSTGSVTIGGSEVQLLGSRSFLQSVLFAPRGATGTFKSDLWLHNSSAFPVLVRITFRARGAGIAPVRRDVTVAAGSSVFLPNVVSSLFGQTNQQGSLSLEYLVPAAQSGATPLVHAFSRSYVDQANPADGSFGQLVSEEPESTWSAAPKVVPGIFEGSGFISTVMAANLDATAGQVTVELLDRQGASVGSAVLSLDANGVRFQTIARLFPAAASHTGPFTARFTSNGIRFAASATLLDAGSQDQIFIPATPVVSGVDHGEVWFPRVVRNRGQFNTFLVSKLVAYNPASERRQLTLELWLRGQDNTTPLVVQREVEAGQSLLVDDVVRDLFALEEGTGALHVTWSGPQGPDMRLISLTFAETQGQGKRFGTLVDSARAGDAATTRGVDFGAELTGVSRSSYGAVSLSAAPTTLRLTLKSAAGAVLGTADIGLQPRQHFERSLAGIFTGLADGTNQFIETQVVSGGPVLTYLANINVSGDVFYVPGHAE